MNLSNNSSYNHNPNKGMAFRGNQNRNRNFGGNNYGGGGGGGGPMGANRMGNLNMSPWDTPNPGGSFGSGNMRQGGGGQGMNAQAINLANNLLNNLFRNQNPPSLLDLPRGGGGMGNRNQRGGPMVNRGGGGGPGNRLNRRVQGGFQNRGSVGAKVTQKQGAGGIRKQNAFDRAKKLLAKNATNKKKDSASGEKKNESVSTSKESPYASVPNDMFYCHLCKKHMWDANSFENHIKGRTHLMMREGIEESYRLKANMIRQEAKIAEQLKSIELDRLKRMGKTKQRLLEYCTMCDLNFHGHISAHRKSDGHLQLKKFLHPKCIECNKEFATRIDFDSHLLSADHLKKAAEKNTKVGERKRNTLTILTEEEELKDVRPPQKKKKKVVARKADGTDGVDVKKEGEGGEAGDGDDADGDEGEKKDGDEAGDETKDGDELNETMEEEETVLPVDREDCILDYADGDDIPTEVDNRLPKYNWTRPVGAGLITKLECFECSLCGKFFDTEKTVEIHSRTVTHHRNFLKFINEKSSDTKIAQKRAAAAQEESERKKRKLEEAEAAASTEVKPENGDGDGEGEGGGDVGGEGNDELYDPSEATGDDDDVEMAENGEGVDDVGEDVDDVGEDVDDVGEGDGGDVDDEMDALEEAEGDAEQAAVDELKPTPDPVKVVETKSERAKTPVKQAASASLATPAATPTSAAATPTLAPTPTPVATPVPTTPNLEATPAKKATPTARGGGAQTKGTPRGRPRGRYNRY